MTSTIIPTLKRGIAMGLVQNGPERMGEVIVFPKTDGAEVTKKSLIRCFMTKRGTSKMSETETVSFPAYNGYVTVSKDASIGMITLRGALNSKGLGLAVGKSLPKERSILDGKDMQVAWMSPDELMVLCPKENVAKLEAEFQNRWITPFAGYGCF